MKKLYIFCISLLLTALAHADDAQIEQVDKLFANKRACPLSQVQEILGEEADAGYISTDGNSYLLILGRSLQDCPSMVQYFVDSGALETLSHGDATTGILPMNLLETDYIHYEESNYKGNKSANLLLSYITDPTYKLLNHSFWRNASVEDLQSILPEADLNAETVVYVDWKKKANMKAVDFALESKRPEMLMALMAYTPELSWQNEAGMTPLMRAAKYCDASIVAAMIEAAGESINLRDGKDYSALNYAEFCSNGETVCNPEKSKLISAAMSPTQRMLSYTYWRYATPDQVKADIAAGADLNATMNTELGKQPVLWFAVVASNDYNVIQLLLNSKVQKSYGTATNNIFDMVNYFRIYNDQDKMINFLMKNGIRKP